MSNLPCFETGDDLVRLRITDRKGYREVNFECILDLTFDEYVVGFEVLDIRRQLDDAPITPTRINEYFSWSYDPEIDASYFHLQRGSGQVQVKKTGVAVLDEQGDLVELRVPI
jgi:hypothetical protein